jgi:hypothetical protein
MSAANPDVIFGLLQRGNRNRIQEATGQNESSSRSHAILQIYVAYKAKEKSKSRFAKLSLCDLAGSERAAETINRGMRMREGANINRSLLALGNCINSLVEPGRKSDYVNFRDSKLTRLLKDSLGGNCQTVMIANISPCVTAIEDTMNTLKYASRARKIKNKVTQQTSEQLAKSLQEFQEEFRAKKKEQEVHPLAHTRSQSMELQRHSTLNPFPALPSIIEKSGPLQLTLPSSSSIIIQKSSPVQSTTLLLKKSSTTQIKPPFSSLEIQENLSSLFMKQLEIRSAELDIQEHDANHNRRRDRVKEDMLEIENDAKFSKNEGKRKQMKGKLDKLHGENLRLLSLLQENQSSRESLKKEKLMIDQKIYKIQEAASRQKEEYFAEYIKTEVKGHQLEMKSMSTFSYL